MMEPRAFTVWFTGLSGSGKSTLAQALSAQLQVLSLPHQLLDGDELRRTMCRDLAFSKEDRDENVRRIAAFAAAINNDNIIAIVALISPYRAARLKARQACGHFVEVFVDCSLDTLIRRDTKGLYQRAMTGEIEKFSGISDPYEPPENPEIYLHTDVQSEAESLEHLLSRLEQLQYLPTGATASLIAKLRV
jgi:adenylylsulfate kinase